MSRFALIPNNQFKRDAKKRWEVLLSAEWMTVAHCLMNGSAMPEKYRDHALSGDWQGCRECHIKPDLLLIYEKGESSIQLIRLGSHAELF